MGYETKYTLTFQTVKNAPKIPRCPNGTCEHCDQKFTARFSFCPYCGESTKVPEPVERAKRIFADFLAENEEARYCLRDDGSLNDSGRWYKHHGDVERLSKKLTGVLLTLECHGEDGAAWKVYAFEGKSQRADGVMVYPDCKIII